MNLKSNLTPTQDLLYIWGQVLHRPGQTISTKGLDRRASSPCQILLQRRAIQASSPLSEPAGPHGSYPAISGVCPPSLTSHPVVPEVPLEPRNPKLATPNLCHQGSRPSASVVVSQGTPLPGNAFYITQHHHHYHYGCEHGGMGRPLPTARVNHATLQCSLEQEIFGQTCMYLLIESDNTTTVSYINKQGGVVSQDP